MAVDDSLGDPEAQPGAHILLGGEERLEDALVVLGGNSRPVIFNHHLDRVAAGSSMQRRRTVMVPSELTASAALEMRFEMACFSSPGTPRNGGHSSKLAFDHDVLGVNFVRVKAQNRLHQRRQVNQTPGHAGIAIEPERLARDMGHALQLLFRE
jgi:hypothetical protein